MIDVQKIFDEGNFEFLDIKESPKRLLRKEDFGKEQWIPTNQIKADMQVQRELMPNHVEKIVRKFDASSFGRLIVTLREDGYYYVSDGNHRLNAARELDLSEVPCVVISCPTLRDEGISFININETSAKVSAIDKYRIGCSAQVSEWLRVKEVIDYCGLQVTGNGQGIACVSTVYKQVNSAKVQSSIENNINIAKYSMQILNEAYGVEAITHLTFSSMCTFVKAYVMNGDVSKRELIDRLKSSDIKSITSRATEMRKSANRGKLISYVAYLFYVEYNKGLRKKLPLRIDI